MRRCALLVCVSALLAVLAMTASPASADYWKGCGRPKVATSGKVRAHNLGCRKANGLIKAFLAAAQAQGPHVVIDGFSCDGTAGSAFIVSCVRGESRARFNGGVG